MNEIKVTKNTWDKEYNSILLNITKDELKQIDEIIASGEKNRMLNIDLINKILIKVDFCGVNEYIKTNKIHDKNEFLHQNAYRIFRTCATSIEFTQKIKNYILEKKY